MYHNTHNYFWLNLSCYHIIPSQMIVQMVDPRIARGKTNVPSNNGNVYKWRLLGIWQSKYFFVFVVPVPLHSTITRLYGSQKNVCYSTIDLLLSHLYPLSSGNISPRSAFQESLGYHQSLGLRSGKNGSGEKWNPHETRSLAQDHSWSRASWLS